MSEDPCAPRITHLAWGRIETEDGACFKDAKLFPGGGREWDWRETGTHHVPGIQPADVSELLDHGIDTVVLSQGHWRRLRIGSGTLDLLRDSGVEVRVDETEAAAKIYNDLRRSRRVGGLFHSTC